MDGAIVRSGAPAAEEERLACLRALEILDTPPEASFDRVTRMVASLLNMPMSAVSLIDAKRQWFKSIVGLHDRETPREVSFCAHAMAGESVMEVSDATADPRFADNPLVTGRSRHSFLCRGAAQDAGRCAPGDAVRPRPSASYPECGAAAASGRPGGCRGRCHLPAYGSARRHPA